ncbi:MAG: histidine kinase [Bacilli bacterium]|nr:histidine kinase [Bacilli bacterium]
MIYAYFFVGGALLLLALLGLIAPFFLPGLDKRSKCFFVSSFSVLVLSIAAYVVDLSIYTEPDFAWAGRIVSFIETLLPPLLMPLLTAYILLRCGKRIRESAAFYLSLALYASLLILLIITPFTDIIYYFTQDNQFIRGTFYWVLIVPLFALIALNLFEIIRRRKPLGRRYFIAFLVYLLPLLVAMAIQAFAEVFLLIVISVSISALSMFGIILSDQVSQYFRQQQEIADQRASIAVLQMRPHFIYNTMTSIYYLCEQDAEKAQQVTLDFTTYLRKNFNAITGKDPIPFAEELEHTRAYLAVVQAQFEDSLYVKFDTPHTTFRLPPLTLQPLVENAVKYGLDVDASEPLRVYVKTEKTKGGSVVTIADSGPGFSRDDNGEPHIALSNIRERLSAIGGTLTISPGENGGTLIRIFIPN